MRLVLGSALALLISLFPLGAGAAPAARDPMVHFFEQSFGNLKEEAAQAKAEGKTGMLLMFNDPDCPWCQKMKASVMSQPAVQEYYRRHFRLLHIDTRGDTGMTDFNGREMAEKDFAFKEHRVRATPVFIFFGLDGKPLLRFTGVTASVEEFLWLGEFVVSGAHKDSNFAVYKRKRLAEKN